MGDVLLQPFTPGRDINLGSENVGALSFTQGELNQVTTDDLRVGNPSAGPVTGFNSVSTPTTVNTFEAVGNNTTITILASQVAGLSAVTIPPPKLDTTSFSGASISTDEAAQILPAGSIGTLWLLLPFPPAEEKHYVLEDQSKWTSGRIAAVGSTTGPQSPK